MLTSWPDRPLADLLAVHGLESAPERDFPNDGWSGARLTVLERDTRRFVLKRTSWATDWIARATDDRELREAVVANGGLPLPPTVTTPYLGAAGDRDGAAILATDLTGTLLAWDRPIGQSDLDRAIEGIARLHATAPADTFPWCGVRQRVELLTRPSAERYRADRLWVGARFIGGWDAFDRRTSPAARDLVRRLATDSTPLVASLAMLPRGLLHGDLKLANLGFVEPGIVLIDWQMAMLAPIAIELGWFLVSNVAVLPEPPVATLDRYLAAAERGGMELGDWSAQVDLTWIVGLLLRGWRKGLDADAGAVTGWGWSAAEDLDWWSRQAVEAAERRL